MTKPGAGRNARARRSGEFQLIDSFLAPFGLARDGLSFGEGSGVLAGPGDDCAQLLPSRGKTLVATTDAALDGVHFDLQRQAARDAGWKALAMNLSDLSAAGAAPRWFLCSLGIPTVGTPHNSLAAVARELGRGMAVLAKESGCALVGGNVTRAMQWSLTITALGEAKRPLTRAGAQPGDRLLLVGALGAAALGLQLLQEPASGTPERVRKPAPGKGARDSLRAQLRPVPQLEAGLIAAEFASAAIDISDGLLQDLGHLCARSQVSAEVWCEQLPRSPAVRRAEADGAIRGAHPYALSLAGGEDYALLLAVPPRRAVRLLTHLRAKKLPAFAIGQLTGSLRGRGAITLLEHDRAIPLPARLGHDHLARE